MSALGFLEADPEKRIDPMAIIFPRVTKCSFFKYGPSGTIQTHDAICVLPVHTVDCSNKHDSYDMKVLIDV